MGAKLTKDDRSVEKKNGKLYLHLNQIQEYDQSNVNSMVESFKANKATSSAFLTEYQEKLKLGKETVKKELEKMRDEAKEFIEKMSAMSREDYIQESIALMKKELDKRKEFIDDFDNNVKNGEEALEKQFFAFKQKCAEELKDMDTALEFWNKYVE